MGSWGVWVVLGNASSASIGPKTAAAISYLVATVLAVGFAGIRFVSLCLGLSRGSTTVGSTLGAMYFVVATRTAGSCSPLSASS